MVTSFTHYLLHNKENRTTIFVNGLMKNVSCSSVTTSFSLDCNSIKRCCLWPLFLIIDFKACILQSKSNSTFIYDSIHRHQSRVVFIRLSRLKFHPFSNEVRNLINCCNERILRWRLYAGIKCPRLSCPNRNELIVFCFVYGGSGFTTFLAGSCLEW